MKRDFSKGGKGQRSGRQMRTCGLQNEIWSFWKGTRREKKVESLTKRRFWEGTELDQCVSPSSTVWYTFECTVGAVCFELGITVYYNFLLRGECIHYLLEFLTKPSCIWEYMTPSPYDWWLFFERLIFINGAEITNGYITVRHIIVSDMSYLKLISW